MTFATLGDIIANGPISPDLDARRSTAPRRTYQPIRRKSHLKGQQEARFWQRTKREDVRRIVLAARRYELVTRQPGARSGALGFVALEVLDFLANLVDWKTGRLDPSLDYIMGRLKRSRDAIVRALSALRAHGFIDWLRRFVPTGNEGRGPQVRQTSNAYRLSLPERALRLLGRLVAPSPAPDDFTALRERVEAGMKAYRASLSPSEVALDVIEDPAMRESLARLGKMIERESGKQSESGPKFLFYRD